MLCIGYLVFVGSAAYVVIVINKENYTFMAPLLGVLIAACWQMTRILLKYIGQYRREELSYPDSHDGWDNGDSPGSPARPPAPPPSKSPAWPPQKARMPGVKKTRGKRGARRTKNK